MTSFNLVFLAWEDQVEARKVFRSVVRHKADRPYPALTVGNIRAPGVGTFGPDQGHAKGASGDLLAPVRAARYVLIANVAAAMLACISAPKIGRA